MNVPRLRIQAVIKYIEQTLEYDGIFGDSRRVLEIAGISRSQL